jgi:hypothetical protein
VHWLCLRNFTWFTSLWTTSTFWTSKWLLKHFYVPMYRKATQLWNLFKAIKLHTLLHECVRLPCVCLFCTLKLCPHLCMYVTRSHAYIVVPDRTRMFTYTLTSNQGCQMVNFQTKNPNLGKFSRVLQCKMLVYFMSIWYLLQPFGVFYGHLFHFRVIW